MKWFRVNHLKLFQIIIIIFIGNIIVYLSRGTQIHKERHLFCRNCIKLNLWHQVFIFEQTNFHPILTQGEEVRFGNLTYKNIISRSNKFV